MKHVEIVTELTKKRFNKEYFNKKKPFVLKEGMKETIAFDKWSLDHMKSKYGSKKITVRHGQEHYFNYINVKTELLEMTIDELIDTFSSSEKGYYYMQQVIMSDISSDLANEISLPKWNLKLDKFKKTNLWIGMQGCLTHLHFDKAHNFLCQIRGKKELTLYSPNDKKYLYPSKKQPKHLSQINIVNVDHDTFPLFKQATPYSCTIEEGDILFIPYGWWHQVYSNEDSISVNYWWKRYGVF